MQPNDSHQSVSWTVVILLFSQINIDTDDVVVGGGTGQKAPNQKKQTEEFRDLLANLPIEDGNSVFVVYNQVNVLDIGPQNDYTELLKLDPDSKTFETIQSYDTPGIFQIADKLAGVLDVLRPRIPPSDNLLLMTWDHGSVYGIFKKFKVPPGTKPAEVAGVATFVDLLTPDELAAAIYQGMGRQVDLLVMMNCWMQNIHTVSGLCGVAKTMVASEGLITSFVYDYSIFSRLTNRTPLSVAEEITNNLLPYYIYKYAMTFKLDNLVANCSIFTTVFNPQLDQFLLGVRKLTDKLLRLLINDPQALLIAAYIHDTWILLFKWDWAESGAFGYYMVDLVSFLTTFSQKIASVAEFTTNPIVQSLPGDVKALVDLLPYFNPYPNIGSEPYGVSDTNSYAGVPTGTGIFFPPDQNSFEQSFYSKNLQKTNQIGYYTTANPSWLALLKKYYEIHP